MDFGSYAGYGIPYQVVDGRRRCATVTFDYADESDPGPYPIPVAPLIEDGSDGHMLMVDRVGCTLYELFAARQSRQRHLARGLGRDLGPRRRTTSGPTAGRPPTPPDCRSCPASSAGTRSRPGEINHALRFTAPADPRHVHLPGAPRGVVLAQRVAAADGPARAAQGERGPDRPVARREGDRGRAPALRDDPRRQRLALVRLGRQRPALRRRRPPRAGPVHRAPTSRSSTRAGSSTARNVGRDTQVFVSARPGRGVPRQTSRRFGRPTARKALWSSVVRTMSADMTGKAAWESSAPRRGVDRRIRCRRGEQRLP